MYECINLQPKLIDGELTIGKGGLFAEKVVDIPHLNDESRLRDLQHEVRVLSELNHPHIVRYYGSAVSGRNQNRLHLFMEYVPGGSLLDVVTKFGLLSEPVVQTYCRQILLALEYLHDRGYVHRDLKASNILVTTSSVVKVTDFGTCHKMSRCCEEGDGRAGSMNVEERHAGTPYFFPPERVLEGKIGYQTDVWALGCVLLEMVSGRAPFASGSNYLRVYYRLGSGETPTIPGDVSETLRDFLDQCFLPAEERPSAAALLEHPFITEEVEFDDTIDEMHTEDEDEVPDSFSTVATTLPSMHTATESGLQTASQRYSSPTSLFAPVTMTDSSGEMARQETEFTSATAMNSTTASTLPLLREDSKRAQDKAPLRVQVVEPAPPSPPAAAAAAPQLSSRPQQPLPSPAGQSQGDWWGGVSLSTILLGVSCFFNCAHCVRTLMMLKYRRRRLGWIGRVLWGDELFQDDLLVGNERERHGRPWGRHGCHAHRHHHHHHHHHGTGCTAPSWALRPAMWMFGAVSPTHFNKTARLPPGLPPVPETSTVAPVAEKEQPAGADITEAATQAVLEETPHSVAVVPAPCATTETTSAEDKRVLELLRCGDLHAPCNRFRSIGNAWTKLWGAATSSTLLTFLQIVGAGCVAYKVYKIMKKVKNMVSCKQGAESPCCVRMRKNRQAGLHAIERFIQRARYVIPPSPPPHSDAPHYSTTHFFFDTRRAKDNAHTGASSRACTVAFNSLHGRTWEASAAMCGRQTAASSWGTDTWCWWSILRPLTQRQRTPRRARRARMRIRTRHEQTQSLMACWSTHSVPLPQL